MLNSSKKAYLIVYRGETSTVHQEIIGRFFSFAPLIDFPFLSKSQRSVKADAESMRAKVKVNCRRAL